MWQTSHSPCFRLLYNCCCATGDRCRALLQQHCLWRGSAEAYCMVQHSLRLWLWTWAPALTGQQVSIPLHKHCAHLLLKENININTAFIYLVLLTYKKVREEYIEVKVSQLCHFRENSSIYLEGDEERIAVFCELNISVKGISDVYFLSPMVISRRCHMYLHTHTCT